MTISQLNVAKL